MPIDQTELLKKINKQIQKNEKYKKGELNSLQKGNLQKICKKFKLDTDGNKKVLTQRIVEFTKSKNCSESCPPTKTKTKTKPKTKTKTTPKTKPKPKTKTKPNLIPPSSDDES